VKIHKLPDSPVEIRQLEGMGNRRTTWVCLEDIIEALKAPYPWELDDVMPADRIARILESELLDD
jgi:hypothetical protein